MLKVVVLGAAAGGGVPQWNCGCTVCSQARTASPQLRATQASVALSADGEHWFLINASPDIRQQITQTPVLHPRAGALRHSPITGVILTNGEVDAVAGLLSLREGSPFAIYAHERVLSILEDNSIFNVLDRGKVKRQAIALDEVFEPALPDGSPSGLEIRPFAAPGKAAWYLEGVEHPAGEDAPGDTIGLEIRDKRDGSCLVFLAACAALTPDVAERLRAVQLVFFDGTLWRDDEMIVAGLSQKTGRRMGHMAMSGPEGTIAALADLGSTRKVFLHINNSNPALLPGSPERQAAEAAGWQIGHDGMEIVV